MEHQTWAYGTHVQSGPAGAGVSTGLQMLAAGHSNLGHHTTSSQYHLSAAVYAAVVCEL